jgi:5'-phosphate synthase pdxT subunit
MIVGVLGLQGDFREHHRVFHHLGVPTRDVRTVDGIDAVDALVLPGGESTTMARLMALYGLDAAVRRRGRDGLPLFGTCAGLILMAHEVSGAEPAGLGLIDIAVDRNAYGRQVDSFEADLDVKGIGSLHAVFIRAPKIAEHGPNVEVWAEHDGVPVVAREGNVLVSSFHPELIGEHRIHERFLSFVR